VRTGHTARTYEPFEIETIFPDNTENDLDKLCYEPAQKSRIDYLIGNELIKETVLLHI
jgi:hypothetical protein